MSLVNLFEALRKSISLLSLLFKPLSNNDHSKRELKTAASFFSKEINNRFVRITKCLRVEYNSHNTAERILFKPNVTLMQFKSYV